MSFVWKWFRTQYNGVAKRLAICVKAEDEPPPNTQLEATDTLIPVNSTAMKRKSGGALLDIDVEHPPKLPKNNEALIKSEQKPYKHKSNSNESINSYKDEAASPSKIVNVSPVNNTTQIAPTAKKILQSQKTNFLSSQTSSNVNRDPKFVKNHETHKTKTTLPLLIVTQENEDRNNAKYVQEREPNQFLELTNDQKKLHDKSTANGHQQETQSKELNSVTTPTKLPGGLQFYNSFVGASGDQSSTKRASLKKQEIILTTSNTLLPIDDATKELQKTQSEIDVQTMIDISKTNTTSTINNRNLYDINSQKSSGQGEESKRVSDDINVSKFPNVDLGAKSEKEMFHQVVPFDSTINFINNRNSFPLEGVKCNQGEQINDEIRNGLKKLKIIQDDVETQNIRLKQYEGGGDDVEYRSIKEKLIKCMLRLDDIDDEDEGIRNNVREVLKFCHNSLEELKNKVGGSV